MRLELHGGEGASDERAREQGGGREGEGGLGCWV